MAVHGDDMKSKVLFIVRVMGGRWEGRKSGICIRCKRNVGA